MPKTPPSLIADLQETTLRPLLVELGFQRRGSTWNRKLSKVTHVIEVQRSSTSTRDECSVTLNVGVWSNTVWSIRWDRPAPDFVQEIECFPRFRIGDLIAAWNSRAIDVWWTLRRADTAAAHQEIRDAIIQHALPFLDRFDSIKSITQFCDTTRFRMFPADRINCAIVYHCAGDPAQCESILNSMTADGSDYWQESIASVRGRLH